MSERYGRKVSFIQPGMDRLEECKRVFENSALYDWYFKDTNFLEEWLKGALEEGKVVAAVTSDGVIAGLMICQMKGMFAELPYLALLGVRDSYRGQGIGSRLLDVYADICRQAGYDKCFMCVSHFNPRAKALYQRKGFKPLALIPDMMKAGIDEWVLMKRL